MTKTLIPMVLLLFPLLAFAEKSGQPAREWNKPAPGKQEALHLAGNVERGKALYQQQECAKCHGADANGSPDGKYPALTQQNHTVIIKQLEDIKNGERENPEMLPHVKTLDSGKKIADLAAYLSSLPRTGKNQKGPDNQEEINQGAKIYASRCAKCHVGDGNGDAGHFYPMVAGQHFNYIVKQMTETLQGKRHNSNPTMIESVKGMTSEDIRHVSNYVSRLAPRPQK